MYRATLVTAAAALALAATAVGAQQQKGPDSGPSGAQPQMQQKGPEQGSQMQTPPAGQPQAQEKQEPGPQGAERSDPKGKAPKGAQAEPKDKAPAKSAEPKAPAGKGTAEKGQDAQGKDRKGTAEKQQPQDKDGKGTAEKAQPQPQDKDRKGTAEKAQPQDKATKGAAKKDGDRVQLSQEQRSNVSQSLLKDQRVNRVTKVNFTINVGTRVPRSVRLVALPASVLVIVPAYREYRYFVVEEQIVIVEPATYEIIEVIPVSDRTAGGPAGGSARLVLTEEERSIILSEVDMSGGSTLALGALTEGSEVPRGVELRVFPDVIVQKVPKVRGYKFFAAENRVAIVDEQGAKVHIVIGDRR